MPITQKAQQVQALAQSFIDAANEYQDHDNTIILMAAIGMLLDQLLKVSPQNRTFVLANLQRISADIAARGN